MLLYFKNTELVEEYGVTFKTIRNWITAAESGKLGLRLTKVNDKSYVTKNTGNIVLIEELVRNNKKYRPLRSMKVLSPQPDFYKLFDVAQIYDIITNIEMHREIPREYNYFDGGAISWDEYVKRVDRENTPSNLSMTRELLAKNQSFIDSIIENYEFVNVVDLGAGNAYPVKAFLSHLKDMGKLGRYMAVDISPDMLGVAHKNITEWFGDSVRFEAHQLDITRDRFARLLAEDYVKNTSEQTCNIILFLGGTLQNFRKKDAPLQVINDSMGANDFLVHTQKLDSPATRLQFDFGSKSGDHALPDTHSIVPNLLNITPDLYDMEAGYDKVKKEKYVKIRFKATVKIQIDLDGGKHSIEVEKGQSVQLLRAYQDEAIDIINQFNRNDFYLLQTSQSLDCQYILTISRVKQKLNA